MRKSQQIKDAFRNKIKSVSEHNKNDNMKINGVNIQEFIIKGKDQANTKEQGSNR